MRAGDPDASPTGRFRPYRSACCWSYDPRGRRVADLRALSGVGGPIDSVSEQPAIGSVGAAVVAVLAFVAIAGATIAPVSRAQQLALDECPSSSGQEVVQRVALPGKAGFPLLIDGALWITIQSARATGHGRLARIDAESGRLRSFPLPVDSSRLAYGFGSVWVTGDGKVVRVDAASGRVRSVIRGPRTFGPAIAATSDGVWVGGADIYPSGQGDKTLMHWIYKIDPRRNTVIRQIYLRPTTALDFAADGGSLWVTGWGGVVKVSRSGRLLFQQRFDGVGWSLARTPDAVWVTQAFSGNRHGAPQRPLRRLLRVATMGPRQVTTIDLGVQPGDVSAAAGIVWVGPFVGVNAGLARVDETQTPPAVTSTATGLIPTRIAAFNQGAWVSERDTHSVSEIC